MCNMPKIQKAEVRTGTGGGYNERENVEYKDRVESDDEYDDVRCFFFLFSSTNGWCMVSAQNIKIEYFKK